MQTKNKLITTTIALLFSLNVNAAHIASYYHDKFHGKKTANGERFDQNKLTAAHKYLPFGTIIKVHKGNKSVIVRINDRGPFIKGRDIDLSKSAAKGLGILKQGVATVEIEILTCYC